jgi:hypothetical protein
MEELTTSSLPLGYRIETLLFDWSKQWIKVWIREPTLGQLTPYRYEGETALTMMRQLNKANLSTLSLHRRILERLAADGKLPSGTITGDPD